MAPNTPRLGLETFELLEKDPAGVGGVWRKLKYPGLSCDIPAHFYSFSFERWPHWSRDYPSALEIHPYLVHCVEKYGIRDHISYGVEVTELRWDDDRSVWRVMTKVDGKFVEREFEVVFNSGGVFNKQYTPDYPGIPSFKGEQIQAADDRVVGNDWDRVQLAGKRVSIVGTGPTAIQIISEIAHKVEHLDIYQRTATWILPMDNKPFDEKQRKEFQDDAKLRAYRQNLMDQTERMWLLISKPYSSTAVKIQDRCLRHLRETVKDPELVKKLTPNFPIGAKRIMFDPGYLPSLNRPNVSLHTDPIARVTPDAIVTRDKESGKESEHNTEVIIWATGWGSFSMGVKYPIYGRGGKEIWERWREVGMPRSYQGAMVTEFPNLVLVVGPNTQVWSSFVEGKSGVASVKC
ncbi:hypothetical protein DFJ74DRAFT_721975 [Hyaloraphidium curvatum]|nr:hypothetical protein DFJ74DRAFT_721975 [Hyaloraphidium curvatum]